MIVGGGQRIANKWHAEIARNISSTTTKSLDNTHLFIWENWERLLKSRIYQFLSQTYDLIQISEGTNRTKNWHFWQKTGKKWLIKDFFL